MRLITLSIKNVTGNWWRTLALGLFVFLTSFILIFFNAFSLTITNNMQNSLINSLTGHVQIRSEFTEETDMMAMKASWGSLHYLSDIELEQISSVLISEDLAYTERVRTNAALLNNLEQAHAMIIGLNPAEDHYQSSFALEQGRYLNPGNTGEVLLASYYADQLKVSVGDTIQAASEAGTVNLTVVGIGDVQMLSLFGFYGVYTDLPSARILADFKAGEATDVIVFASSSGETDAVLAKISGQLAKFTLSVWEDMGGFVFNGISIYKGMFVLFIIVMMIIVSILIFNLVFMMGMERRQEIGTLKAIGYSKLRVIQIFMTEILFITVLFCAAGIAGGSALVIGLSNIGFEFGPPMDFAMGKIFYIQYDYKLIFPVAAIIIVFTLAAALWPSWRAASLNPVDSMKD